jgi:hypothetical protein
MLTFEFDAKVLTDQIDAFKAKAETAIRPAAQAGAQVLYDAVKATVPTSKKGHWFHGTSFKAQTGRKFRDGTPRPDWKGGTKYWYDSGSLKGAVYQVFSKSDSTQEKAVYHVAWNHRSVPYGFMVIAGTKSGAKANDFIGRANLSAQARALLAMKTEFDKRMKTS